MIVEKPGWKGAKVLASRLVEISELVPDAENSRTHDERNLEAVRSSLEAEGQVEPILVQESTGMVIAGNARLVAATRLEWTKLAATVVDVDDATARRLSIRLNRTGEMGGWNDDRLADWLRDIPAEEAVAVGWTKAELDALLAATSPPPEFPEYDGDIETKQKCPSCGYEFS